MKDFTFDLQMLNDIQNYTQKKLVIGTAYYDSILNTGDSVSIQAYGGDDTIENYGDSVKIYGGTGDDSIRNEVTGLAQGGKNVSIYGGEGDDTIINDGAYSVIDGNIGDDYILSWGIATISAGKGDDRIELATSDQDGQKNFIKYNYGDGNDTIENFNSNDTLYINTSKSISTMTSGSDMYFVFDNGSIILKNIGDDVTSSNFVVVGNLPTGLSYSSDKTKITASKKFKKSSFSFANYSDVVEFDGTKITRAVKITGNSLDNKISGGTKNDTILGGAGNDTLIGGAGNDVLTGGAGEDIFIYSKGNDVIKDYTAGADIIKLQDTTIKSWKTSGKNVIFTTTKGKITVQNGKGKKITITTSKTYNSSSSALFAENNFVTADNLSEIVKNDLTATDYKIDTQNFENLTQKNNLMTFADK